MTEHRIASRRFIALAAVLVVGIFLFAGHAMAEEQKGEVVIATPWDTFYQVGGDPITHYAGAPVVNQTVFESCILGQRGAKTASRHRQVLEGRAGLENHGHHHPDRREVS